MAPAPQHTLARPATVAGRALHTGAGVRVRLLPAPAATGIVFARLDLPGSADIPARPAFVACCERATTLGAGGERGVGATVATVEHLMAALWAAQIDNVRVEVDGPELPLLDGGATDWCRALQTAAARPQPSPRRRLRVVARIRVEAGAGFAEAAPAAAPSAAGAVTCSIDFGHPLVPTTPVTYALAETAPLAHFAAELAPARTFVRLAELEALRARGLIAGGSLEAAVVLSTAGVVNLGGLRFADECNRHKTLDALGDLALWGTGWRASVRVHRAGHRLHVALVRAVLADPAAHVWETGG